MTIAIYCSILLHMPDMEETVPETGPEAILYALRQLDADKIEAEGRKELESGKKTKRSSAVKKLRIASGLRRNNMTPEAFMMKSVPVLPPKFRPFAVSGETLLMGDANILYKDLMDVRDAHDEERKMFGDKMAGGSRLALYDAVKSVYGYGDAVKPKTRAKDVQGYLRKIVGKTSKFSWMSNKMLAKPVDNVGRSTIIVDPELDMDHIGLPKDLAFTMYAPYVQRRLKQLGMRDAEALKAVKDRTPYAEKALNDVVKERPVWYSRAPQWHRFSINAAYPKIIDAKAIAVPPAPCVGMGADFDGDTINVHVPASDEAVKECKEKLLPSSNPFKDRSEGQVMTLPKQEEILGLYTAATSPDKRTYDFKSEKEALHAIRSGEVPLSANVTINGKG